MEELDDVALLCQFAASRSEAAVEYLNKRTRRTVKVRIAFGGSSGFLNI
jgi:hypothetical protein